MDEALPFSNLDDLSDRETLERLESLFESSLPSVSELLLFFFFFIESEKEKKISQ